MQFRIMLALKREELQGARANKDEFSSSVPPRAPSLSFAPLLPSSCVSLCYFYP